MFSLKRNQLAKFNSFKERIDKQTLYSAMFSINYYKGFSLMRSTNMDETAFIVCNMAYKIGKDPNKQPYFSQILAKMEDTTTTIGVTNNPDSESGLLTQQQQQQAQSKDYCSVIKKVKKDNITEENIGEIMLCQIPGISSVTALTIMEKFKTLPNLIK